MCVFIMNLSFSTSLLLINFPFDSLALREHVESRQYPFLYRIYTKFGHWIKQVVLELS